MNENDKQADQGKDILSTPHPRHFGIPIEHWEAANNYAEYMVQNKQAEPVVQKLLDFPLGAIVNGRVYADRLQNYYSFDCEAGPLSMCSDWIEFLKCFEHMAQYLEHNPAQPVQPAACQYCNGTGDVHGIDGEWRGECKECKPAGAQGGEMSNQASNIQYVPPKCTMCGRPIARFDSMCVSCANKSINNKDDHFSTAAAAINEQLLEVSGKVYELCLSGEFYDDHDKSTGLLGELRAAIRAAEAEKAKGGV